MSKKTMAIVFGVLCGILFCLCLIVATVLYLGRGSLPTSDLLQPTQLPETQTGPAATSTLIVPTETLPTITPEPTVTSEPTITNTPPPTKMPSATPAPFDSEIFLNDTTLKVFGTSYTLLNGGQYGVAYVTKPGEVYLQVSLYSDRKDLGFLYEDYGDSIALFDPVEEKWIDYNFMTWSLEETPSNSGWVQITFPVSSAPSAAVLHIKDGLDIDLTETLPLDMEPYNPWVDGSQNFSLDKTPMKILSVEIFDEYLDLNGNYIEKYKTSDKLLVITFTSPQNDLSYFKDVAAFVLINANDQDLYYEYSYRIWTNETHQGDGSLVYIFSVPDTQDDYVLYIPFGTLIDLKTFMFR